MQFFRFWVAFVFAFAVGGTNFLSVIRCGLGVMLRVLRYSHFRPLFHKFFRVVSLMHNFAFFNRILLHGEKKVANRDFSFVLNSKSAKKYVFFGKNCVEFEAATF